jgi:hypothetical protein
MDVGIHRDPGSPVHLVQKNIRRFSPDPIQLDQRRIIVRHISAVLFQDRLAARTQGSRFLPVKATRVNDFFNITLPGLREGLGGGILIEEG